MQLSSAQKVVSIPRYGYFEFTHLYMQFYDNYTACHLENTSPKDRSNYANQVITIHNDR